MEGGALCKFLFLGNVALERERILWHKQLGTSVHAEGFFAEGDEAG